MTPTAGLLGGIPGYLGDDGRLDANQVNRAAAGVIGMTTGPNDASAPASVQVACPVRGYN